MLKLDNPVSFTVDEQNHISNVLMPLGKKGWSKSDRKTKNIKHKISTHTLQNQGCRCAYCERILEKGGVQIEHIAPKDSNESFCYEPYNLVSSCGICNAIANKGAKDTILPPKNNNYVNNNFKIVHPYFDDPDTHIKYQDPEKTVFDKALCTPKGLGTIDFFNWDTLNAYIARTIIASSRSIPINVAQLILEISLYK